MGAATLDSYYIEPPTTLRSRRAFHLHYTALNFNAVSVWCEVPAALLNESPFFVVDGLSFMFAGTVGTACADILFYLSRGGGSPVRLERWVTVADPQAFCFRNLDLFVDYSSPVSSGYLMAFQFLTGYAAADDFQSIDIWGYIEEAPRPTESPMRVAQDGWYSLKRRT